MASGYDRWRPGVDGMGKIVGVQDSVIAEYAAALALTPD